MKLVKKENIGIQDVFNTNVENTHNYICEGGLINHNCVVDEDYQGEVHIHVVNTSNDAVYITPGMKLVQFILVPVSYLMPEEVPFENLYNEKSERGHGSFGSTGV